MSGPFTLQDFVEFAEAEAAGRGASWVARRRGEEPLEAVAQQPAFPSAPKAGLGSLLSAAMRPVEAAVGGCDACSICLDPLDASKPLVALRCKHMFHKACVTPWLRSNVSCPNCRASAIPADEARELVGGTDYGDDTVAALRANEDKNGPSKASEAAPRPPTRRLRGNRARALRGRAYTPPEDDFDMDAIDIDEQRRILEECARLSAQAQPQADGRAAPSYAHPILRPMYPHFRFRAPPPPSRAAQRIFALHHCKLPRLPQPDCPSSSRKDREIARGEEVSFAVDELPRSSSSRRTSENERAEQVPERRRAAPPVIMVDDLFRNDDAEDADVQIISGPALRHGRAPFVSGVEAAAAAARRRTSNMARARESTRMGEAAPRADPAHHALSHTEPLAQPASQQPLMAPASDLPAADMQP